MSRWIKNITSKIFHPVIEELPFFVMMMMLIGYRAIYMLFFHFQMWMHEPGYPRLRIIGITLVYAYMMTLIVYVSKRRWVKFAFYTLFIFLFCVNFYLQISFGSSILLSSMLLLFETNANEVRDFTIAYLLSRSGILALAFLVFISFVAYLGDSHKIVFTRAYHKLKTSVKTLLSVAFCCCLFCGFYSFHIYYELFLCDNTDETDAWSYKVGTALFDQVTNCIFSTYDLYLTGKNLAIAERITEASCNSPICIDDSFKSTNIILVIGESFIKYHSSLYGYSLKTNPRLEEEKQAGNLFVFNDVVSPFIYTSDALRNMLSANSLGDGEKWYDHPFFPAIFHKAGYNVMFWDNQYSISSGPFDFTLNAYIHSPQISRMSYHNKQSFVSNIDGYMVDDFIHSWVSSEKHQNNFVIFHLQGQHFLAESHYPQMSDFKVFTPNDVKSDNQLLTPEMKMEIAHYDNCTQYNDFVLKRIIDLFRNESSVIVYLSDHGENVYDLGDYKGRRISDVTEKGAKGIHYLLDIPFFVWCSDKYKERHPRLVKALEHSVEKPMMSDNICHLFMRLGGVQCEDYGASRDILSPKYQCPPRIVCGTLDYDLLK